MDWPEKCNITAALNPYWKVRNSLTVHNCLLLYNDRIVVSELLRKETLLRIHEGHQGLERCRMWARMSVWWPELARELSEVVAQCRVCVGDSAVRREPLLTTPLPDYPWQVVGSDLFSLNGAKYLLTVDYFSRYPEVIS